jgi:hypothetical protein
MKENADAGEITPGALSGRGNFLQVMAKRNLSGGAEYRADGKEKSLIRAVMLNKSFRAK